MHYPPFFGNMIGNCHQVPQFMGDNTPFLFNIGVSRNKHIVQIIMLWPFRAERQAPPLLPPSQARPRPVNRKLPQL